MTTITRIYRFPASHRLHSPLLTDMENAAVFGKCNNPYGHGHDYVLSVTVAGRVDEETGLLVGIGDLDRLVDEKILRAFSHRNVNLDIPQFAHLVPTTENMALVITDLLQADWNEYIRNTSAHLQRVHIQETERNGFEVLLPALQSGEKHQTGSSLTYA